MGKKLLKLFVVANTPSGRVAIDSVKYLCTQLLDHQWDLEVIDVTQHPEQAEQELITAVPALIVDHTTKRLIGDLENPKEIILALGLKELA